MQLLSSHASFLIVVETTDALVYWPSIQHIDLQPKDPTVCNSTHYQLHIFHSTINK